MRTEFDVGDTVLVPMKVKHIKADRDGWYYVVGRNGVDLKVTEADLQDSAAVHATLLAVKGLAGTCEMALKQTSRTAEKEGDSEKE